MGVLEHSSAPRTRVESATGPASRRVTRQFVSFALVGAFGYVIDAAVTYVCARYLGLSAELARPPGFVIATIVNFLLNRSITFRDSRTPAFRAFVRYCAVASVGLAINYAAYTLCVVLSPRFGVPVTPAILPLFVLVGVAAATAMTFVGFRLFAFR